MLFNNIHASNYTMVAQARASVVFFHIKAYTCYNYTISWAFSRYTVPWAWTVGINFVMVLTVCKIFSLPLDRVKVAPLRLKCLLCSAKLPLVKDDTGYPLSRGIIGIPKSFETKTCVLWIEVNSIVSFIRSVLYQVPLYFARSVP